MDLALTVISLRTVPRHWLGDQVEQSGYPGGPLRLV